MTINSKLSSDPRTLTVEIDGKECDECNRITKLYRNETLLACDTSALIRYLIVRRFDKMAVCDGVYEGDVAPSKIVKFTLTADEIECIDGFRRDIETKTGVAITRNQAIKALIKKALEGFD